MWQILLLLASIAPALSFGYDYKSFWNGGRNSNSNSYFTANNYYNNKQNQRNHMEAFRSRYSKNYHSVSELTYRNTVFKRNLESIDQNNANSQSKYHMGVTQFTDMTF